MHYQFEGEIIGIYSHRKKHWSAKWRNFFMPEYLNLLIVPGLQKQCWFAGKTRVNWDLFLTKGLSGPFSGKPRVRYQLWTQFWTARPPLGSITFFEYWPQERLISIKNSAGGRKQDCYPDGTDRHIFLPASLMEISQAPGIFRRYYHKLEDPRHGNVAGLPGYSDRLFFQYPGNGEKICNNFWQTSISETQDPPGEIALWCYKGKVYRSCFRSKWYFYWRIPIRHC